MASRASARVATVTRVRRCAEEVRGGLELAWPARVVAALAGQAERVASLGDALPAVVTGHTTPACADIGRGSLRVQFSPPPSAHRAREPPEGGLIVGVRVAPHAGFLPAVAAAPGDRGPDRLGRSRAGLAELVVLARPTARPSTEAELLTCLDDATLRAWAPEGAEAEVAVLARVADFHLGLNANRWLKIRMREIADAAEPLARNLTAAREEENVEEGAEVVGVLNGVEGGVRPEEGGHAALLRRAGLRPDDAKSGFVSERPADAAHVFEYWGAGGNTGVSGQVTGFEARA